MFFTPPKILQIADTLVLKESLVSKHHLQDTNYYCAYRRINTSPIVYGLKAVSRPYSFEELLTVAIYGSLFKCFK